MNDTTIIKAELCDFLSARGKNLANIQNMDDREVYIRMIVDASNQIENLNNLFSQFEKVDEILGFNHVVSSNNNFTQTIDDENIGNDKKDVVPVDDEKNKVPLEKEKSIDVVDKIDTGSTIQDDGTKTDEVNKTLVDSVIPVDKANNDIETNDEKVSDNNKDIGTPIDFNDIDVKTTPLPFININTGKDNNLDKSIDTSNNTNDTMNTSVNPFTSGNETTVSNEVIPQVPAVTTDVALENKNTFSDIFKNVNIGVEEGNSNEVNNGLVNNSTVNNNVKMRILKMKSDRVKAILVSQKQMTKLRASKDLQKSVLDFGTAEGVSVSNDSVQSQIESLMAQASLLYKEGKMQEAQALYAKISELNKNSN